MRYALFFIFAIQFFTLTPNGAHAQFNPQGMTTALLTSQPETPGPLTPITITFTTYSFDLMRSYITWSVNGTVVYQGVGASKLAAKTGPAGTATVIKAVAVTPSKQTITASLILRPAHVSIAWEALTYAHPFYKGKSLASPGATMRYVAMPLVVDAKGKRISPDELVYTWRLNNQPQKDHSGYGKRVFTVTPTTYLRSTEVSVEVSTFDKTIVAKTKAKIPTSQPQTRLYIYHPLMGVVYGSAVAGNYPLAGEETSLVAEPYYFSAASRKETDLEYTWTINGGAGARESIVTFRPESGGAGSAQVELKLRHLSQVLQSTRNALMIRFGQSNAATSSRVTESPDAYESF